MPIPVLPPNGQRPWPTVFAGMGPFVALGGTTEYPVEVRHGFELTPYDFGAYGDGVYLLDSGATMASGNPTVTFTTAAFTSKDVGKSIWINGGGTAATYAGIVTGVPSSGSITVSPTPTQSFTAQANTMIAWGHDDTAAINLWLAATVTQPGIIPLGGFITQGGHILTLNQSINGSPSFFNGPNPNGSPLFIHVNTATQSLFSSTTQGSHISGINVVCVNWNLLAPDVAPPTFQKISKISHVNVLFPYIAVQDPHRIDHCYVGNDHFRTLQYTTASKDVNFANFIESNWAGFWPSGGRETTFRNTNLIMIEQAGGTGVAALMATNVGLITCLGLFTTSGSGPVGGTSIQNFWCEGSAQSVTLTAGVTPGQHFVFSNGYFLTDSNRGDELYNVLANGASSTHPFVLHSIYFATHADAIQVKNGRVRVSNCYFAGGLSGTYGNPNGIHMFVPGASPGAGTCLVTGCEFDSYASPGHHLVFESAAGGLTWGSDNVVVGQATVGGAGNSEVNNTFLSKFNGAAAVHTAVEFGADPFGNVDSTLALQALFTQGGILTPGTYLVSGTLTASASVLGCGNDPADGAYIKMVVTNGSPAIPVIVTGAGNITLSNFAVDQNKSGNGLIAPTGYGATSNGGSGIIVEHTQVRLNGILVQNTWHDGITVGVINSSTGAISANLPTDVTIAECRTNNCGTGSTTGAGVANVSSPRMQVVACKDNASVYAVYAESGNGASGVVIGCSSDTAGTAAWKDDSTFTQWLGNVVSGAAGGAITLDGPGTWTANGSVATALSSIGPTGSHTTVQKWLTVTDNTGTKRYIPAF